MGSALFAGAPVRLRPAPRCDPPYDDEQPCDQWAPAAPPLFALPQPAAAAPPARQPAPAATSPADAGGPAVATGRAASPATTAAAARFMNILLEIFNGYRPAGHIRALASPLSMQAVTTEISGALRRLQRATGGTGGRGALVKLRQMRTCQPRSGVAEIAAVIGAGAATTPRAPAAARRSTRGIPPEPAGRVWGLACRLEQHRGRWCCVAAQLL